MPANWLVWDRIREFTRSNRIYQQERILQDQSSIDKLAVGGDFLDFSSQNAILQQTNLQINRLERYKDYEQMDQTGEISLALDLYCLAGYTRIPLLDGTCPTIKELTESGVDKFWVYGFVNGNLKPVLARNPHISGRNAKLLRVSWGSGFIDATPSHQFLTKRGLVRAADLIPGDSLEPLNLVRGCVQPVDADHRVAQSIRRGYEAIQVSGEWTQTHKWVYETFNGKLPIGYVIHHDDIRHKNNRPDNLRSLLWLEHRELHEKIGRLPPEIEAQRRASVSRKIKEKWQDPVYRAKMIPHCRNRGKQLRDSGVAFRGGSKPTSSWEIVCDTASQLGWSLNQYTLIAACKISIATLQRMLRRAGLSWSEFKDKYSNNQQSQIEVERGSRPRALLRRCAREIINANLDLYDWDTSVGLLPRDNKPTKEKVEYYFGSLNALATEVGYNHTVVSVIELAETATEVYDLYVDEGHLFAAGTTDGEWVITHNSDECISGRTVIPLLDGSRPTVSELAAKGPDHKFWVYAKNDAGQYVPAEAYNARVTRKNAEMVRVLLDDTSYLRVTPDHLFMLRDGSYREARLLQQGDSLMPLYLKTRYRGKKTKYYEKLPYPTAGQYDFIYDGEHFTSVHRWAYESLHDDRPEVIHHSNFRGRDNTPRNLIGMTWSEHTELHRKLGPDNPSYNKITLEEIRSKLEGWRGSLKRKDILKLLGVGFRVLDRLLAGAGLTWEDFKSKYHKCECGEQLTGIRKVCDKCKVVYLHDWHQKQKDNPKTRQRWILAKRASYNRCEAAKRKICRCCGNELPIECFQKTKCSISPYCKECRPAIVQKRYLEKCFNNHKVVAIIPDGIEEEVFDITVPGYNCFAAGTSDSWVIVHNCSLIDPEYKHGLIIRAANRRIKQDLEELFFDTLLVDRWLRPAVRYLCKFGDAAFEVVTDRNRTGVSSLRFMNIYNFTRIETRFGDLVGFFYQDEMYPEPVFMHPWSCMHMRLTNFESVYSPYGRAVIDGSRKPFKQLRLMEDASLIYRITRGPEKRKYKIPVGMIPPKEVPEYLLSIARLFKRQRFYNPTTGTFDERFSPIVQEDDFFLPMRPDGTGPDIEVLPGGENMDKISDIEYFKKKMISPLKIPFARVGIGEGAGEPNEKSLAQSDAEFAKAVQWIQSEVALSLQKVGIIHLALRGYSVQDIKGFSLSLASSSALDDLYRMETWATRVSVMSDLKEIGWFPKTWIVTRFTDLSPDEIQEMEELAEEEAGEEGDEEGGGGGLGGDLGDDMGGDEGGGEDIDIDMDMEGGEEGEEGGEDEEGGGEEGGEEEEFELEHRKAERKMLLEIRRDARRSKRYSNLVKTSERAKKISSSFQYLLESKELDGLTKTAKSDNDLLTEDVQDGGLLVEWSVPKNLRDEAIAEIRSVIKNQLVVVVTDTDISSDDLPN